MHDRGRFEFEVCTFWKAGAAAAEVKRSGTNLTVLGVDPNPRNIRAFLTLVDFLLDVRPDVLHCSIAEGNWHGVLAGKLVGIPVVIAEEVGVPTRPPVTRKIFGALWRMVDAVVAVSEVSRQWLVEKDGAPESVAKLIYNCARPEYFENKEVRVSNDARRFLMVGRLVPVKNQATIIRAMERVVRECPDARLEIAGDGPLRAELAALISSLGLDENVALLGFRSDVDELLQHADVFLLPSITEGCSISLVEAMASGNVVIGSNADGIREVMRGAGERCFVESHDQRGWEDRLIELTRSSAAERQAIAERLQLSAYQGFSPSVYLQNVESLYEDLLAAAGEG